METRAATFYQNLKLFFNWKTFLIFIIFPSTTTVLKRLGWKKEKNHHYHHYLSPAIIVIHYYFTSYSSSIIYRAETSPYYWHCYICCFYCVFSLHTFGKKKTTELLCRYGAKGTEVSARLFVFLHNFHKFLLLLLLLGNPFPLYFLILSSLSFLILLFPARMRKKDREKQKEKVLCVKIF